MLLSYFRKIDAYSGIRIFALAFMALALTGIDADFEWDRLLLATALGAAWLFLSWTVMRDHWVVRGTLFRYLIFVMLAVYWSGEYYLTDFLFIGLVFELNWHLIELHRRKSNTIYVLHSGTLTAIAGLWSPDEVVGIIAPAVVLTWLVSGALKIRTLIQWSLAFVIPTAVLYGLGKVELGLIRYAGSSAPVSWWILPLVLAVFALFEWFQSYRKANQMNKSRAVVAGFWLVIGAIAALLGAVSGGVLFFLGLSFHLTNGLRYLKNERLANLLVVGLTIFILSSYFNLIPW
ncbi:MAG: Uncharacterised protein [Flavobacteriales bacterium UBA4585]|nr:MAG: Uncharacterised protein [Flavobacteriales bacterium UBA4585]